MAFLAPEGAPREKILVFGDAKVGKTSAWLSIAEVYKQTDTSGTFWCIDTDDAMERMLWGKSLTNVETIPARHWTSYREASDKACANAIKGDWIVVDFIDRAWEAVRDWYLQEINDESPEEYFFRRKQELKAEGKNSKKQRLSLYDEIDWDVVKPEYNSFIRPMIFDSPAHLFFVCEEKQVWEGGTPVEGKTKPGGHGGLPFQVHSVIKLGKSASRRYINNTSQGDRERPELKNETYENFAIDYLAKAASWRMA